MADLPLVHSGMYAPLVFVKNIQGFVHLSHIAKVQGAVV
jgi:hypothetical protein